MPRLQRQLPSSPARSLPHARAWNITARTVHIAVTGILLGGHTFGVAADELRPVLWLVIASGSALTAIEAWPSLHWVHQGNGVMVLLKLLLLCLVPFAWSARVPILLAVVVLASVGSHMPGRYRHYSLLYRRQMKS